MAKEVIINTEGINCYGTRVITAGIDTTQYLKNPILLFMHKRDYSTEYLPVGTIENLRYKGANLIGTPVFDEDDTFALKLKSKWEKGVLRMASAGIEPLEYSSAPEHIKPGQTRPTVTRSKLIEVSIVDIGANDDAIQLYQPDGKLLTLSKNGECDFIPLLESVPDTEPTEGNDLRDGIITLLGLENTATDTEILDAVKSLIESPDNLDSEVEDAIKLGFIESSQKANFLAMASANYIAFTSFINIRKKEQLPEIENMVQAVSREGKILAQDEHLYLSIGQKIGRDSLGKLFSTFRKPIKPLDIMNLKKEDDWGLTEYRKFKPLELKNNPDLYEKLLKKELKPDEQVETLEYYRRNNPEFLRKNPDIYAKLLEEDLNK